LLLKENCQNLFQGSIELNSPFYFEIHQKPKTIDSAFWTNSPVFIK
jgi:hypothetical protein